MLSRELWGQNSLHCLVCTRSLIQEGGCGREPLRLLIIEKNEFGQWLYFSTGTFLPLIVPCRPNQNTVYPLFPTPSSTSVIIGFCEWKFLCLWECRKRVKLKPWFQPLWWESESANTLSLGHNLCLYLPPYCLSSTSTSQDWGNGLLKSLSNLVHQTQKGKDTLNAIWLYLLIVNPLFQEQLNRYRFLLQRAVYRNRLKKGFVFNILNNKLI